jgi:CheY-like chemotaxis protein
MEGDISVNSIEGEGSKFDFQIIVQKQEVDNSELQTKVEKNLLAEIEEAQFTDADIKRHIPKRKGFKILLAEDNLINQKVAIRTLYSAGYEVDAVMNGEQAVRAHTQNHYDLILMDVQMPDVDGFAATKMIRALPEPKNKVPIIAITAHALIGDRERCIEAGMDEYVPKPMVAKDIVRLIDHFLKVNYHDDKKVLEEVYDFRLFDFERLKQISLGDEVFEKDLLGDYLVDAEQKLLLLRVLHSKGDINKIVDLAHTLKGSSYSVGAKLVGDEALGIELSAKNNDLENVEERLAKLAKSIRETRGVLKNKI